MGAGTLFVREGEVGEQGVTRPIDETTSCSSGGDHPANLMKRLQEGGR